VNRSLEEDMELSLCLEGFEGGKVIEHVELYNDDLKAVNLAGAEAVAPGNVPVGDAVMLRKHSWNMIRVKY